MSGPTIYIAAVPVELRLFRYESSTDRNKMLGNFDYTDAEDF